MTFRDEIIEELKKLEIAELQSVIARVNNYILNGVSYSKLAEYLRQIMSLTTNIEWKFKKYYDLHLVGPVNLVEKTVIDNFGLDELVSNRYVIKLFDRSYKNNDKLFLIDRYNEPSLIKLFDNNYNINKELINCCTEFPILINSLEDLGRYITIKKNNINNIKPLYSKYENIEDHEYNKKYGLVMKRLVNNKNSN